MRITSIITMSLILLLSGCSTIKESKQAVFPAQARFGVVPLANNTETPMAGRRASAMLVSLLHTRGINNQVSYAPSAKSKSLLPQPTAQLSPAQLQHFARRNHARYLITGAVNEWRYKVGIDGEPAVAVSLQIIDAHNMQVIWSSVGAKTATSRQSVGYLGQKLLVQLTHGIRLG